MKKHLFKYTNIEGFWGIMNNNSVKLDCPENYNDIFDALLYVSKGIQRRTIELIFDFLILKSFKENLDNSQEDNVFTRFVRWEVNRELKRIKRTGKYSYTLFLGGFFRVFAMNNKGFVEKKNDAKEAYREYIKSAFEIIRQKTLVSCFSKRDDSILMWAHYADKNRGACVEWIMDDDVFIDVEYRKKVRPVDTYKIVKLILADKFLDVDSKITDEKVARYAIKPFVTKGKDWKYEKEIRCVFVKNNDLDSRVWFDSEKKIYLFDMKALPSKVYLGYKMEPEEKEKAIQMCKERGIECVEMKIDGIHYQLFE